MDDLATGKFTCQKCGHEQDWSVDISLKPAAGFEFSRPAQFTESFVMNASIAGSSLNHARGPAIEDGHSLYFHSSDGQWREVAVPRGLGTFDVQSIDGVYKGKLAICEIGGKRHVDWCELVSKRE